MSLESNALVGGSALGSGQAAEDRRSDLSEISGQLEDSLSRLRVLDNYLADIRDRLYGSEPVAEGTAVRECRSGAIGKIQDQAETLSNLVTSIEQSARRIDGAA